MEVQQNTQPGNRPARSFAEKIIMNELTLNRVKLAVRTRAR